MEKATNTVPVPTDSAAKPGALLNVELEDDQEVEWVWTHYADGKSAVTGYRTMVRKGRPATKKFVRQHPATVEDAQA